MNKKTLIAIFESQFEKGISPDVLKHATMKACEELHSHCMSEYNRFTKHESQLSSIRKHVTMWQSAINELNKKHNTRVDPDLFLVNFRILHPDLIKGAYPWLK